MFEWISSWKWGITIFLFVIVIPSLSFAFYLKEQDLLNYKMQVIQLEVDNVILKSNLESVRHLFESEKQQYKKYRELHSIADSEVSELRKKNTTLDKRNIEFIYKLKNLKEELTIAETKLLEYKIPAIIIDTYNIDSMFSKQIKKK